MIETIKQPGDVALPWADVPAQAWPWPWQVSPEAAWEGAMRQVASWLAEQGVSPRDARVVVPVGAVLSLARKAWSAVSPGWMPAIDTIAGWAQQAAWDAPAPEPVAAGDWPTMTLHPIADRMHLKATWAKQGWASAWQRRDPKGHDHGLGKVVDMAHAVVRRLQAVAPEARLAWVERALADVGTRAPAGQAAPGARESLLQQWAVGWAGHVASQGLTGDAMFAQRPAAVVVMVAGDTVAPGTEAHWSLSLLAHWQALGVPVLRLHAQPQAVAAVPAEQAPTLLRCTDAEDEAQQASALILQTVAEQRALGDAGLPVALLALDRSVVRRMRAVLEGAGVRLADETGWRLSTTRAASALTRLVRAARPEASTEDWLDWLKSGWLPAVVDDPAGGIDVPGATAVLEAHCRRYQVLQAWTMLDDGQLPDVAQTLCRWAQGALAGLHARWQSRGGRLSEWLLALREALQATGAWDICQQDEAGWAAWQALSGDEAMPDTGGWAGLADKTRLDGHRFVRWVSDVMEATVFRPPSPPQADVVITTLARATLRPFAALVMPGGHLGQLGALEPVDPWQSGAWARSLDLSTPSARRTMQWEAWALLMHQPRMCCLVREGQGSEPLSPSPWLTQWSQSTGVAIQAGTDPRGSLPLQTQACRRPAPVVWPTLVPRRVTATAYEALRDCPYRYFAAHVLGLRSQDELEEGVDHADHGTWLHEVLRRFHAQRAQWPQALNRTEALALWQQCVREVAQDQGLTNAAMRPYFAPYLADAHRLGEVYLDWLTGHEALGWQVQWMEHKVEAELRGELAGPLLLHGQIDRMDRSEPSAQAEGVKHLLLDYKTGSLTRLKAKVRTPDEDTQLAFYAVLAQEHPQGPGAQQQAQPVQAGYLHLHRDEVTLVPHEDVAETAQRLQQAIAVDWQRLQAGLGMAALGEGPACAYCEHAGLCRKAHWPQVAEPPVQPPQEEQP